ncbi:MAG: hypothetical protein ACLUE2_06710 [Bacteroides cellulosilyticus]
MHCLLYQGRYNMFQPGTEEEGISCNRHAKTVPVSLPSHRWLQGLLTTTDVDDAGIPGRFADCQRWIPEEEAALTKSAQ